MFLLPYRPNTDPCAARAFIRNFFKQKPRPHGEDLKSDLRLTDASVLISILKWCWSRLAGGVVSWDAYELFRTGEQGTYIRQSLLTSMH